MEDLTTGVSLKRRNTAAAMAVTVNPTQENPIETRASVSVHFTNSMGIWMHTETLGFKERIEF